LQLNAIFSAIELVQNFLPDPVDYTFFQGFFHQNPQF